MTDKSSDDVTRAVHHQNHFKVIVLDMDSTLLDAETINTLAYEAGSGEDVAALTKLAMEGKINYADALRRRVKTLKGLPLENAIKAVNSMPYMKGAKELIKRLKELGLMVVMISCGFTIATERVARELNIEHVISNELVVNDNIITGEVRWKLTYGDAKRDALLDFLSERGLTLKDAIIVGDGANDLSMFDGAGYSIAFNAKPILKSHADHVVDEKDLRHIIPIVEVLCRRGGENKEETRSAE
ncbi:MAG: phosphoserine phosphatase SerB [Methermicoccaceae archaeon]